MNTSYQGAVLSRLWRYDHQLIQTVCNRVFDFTAGGKLIDSKTTYDEYLERQRAAE